MSKQDYEYCENYITDTVNTAELVFAAMQADPRYKSDIYATSSRQYDLLELFGDFGLLSLVGGSWLGPLKDAVDAEANEALSFGFSRLTTILQVAERQVHSNSKPDVAVAMTALIGLSAGIVAGRPDTSPLPNGAAGASLLQQRMDEMSGGRLNSDWTLQRVEEAFRWKGVQDAVAAAEDSIQAGQQSDLDTYNAATVTADDARSAAYATADTAHETAMAAAETAYQPARSLAATRRNTLKAIDTSRSLADVQADIDAMLASADGTLPPE